MIGTKDNCYHKNGPKGSEENYENINGKEEDESWLRDSKGGDDGDARSKEQHVFTYIREVSV